MMKNLIEDISTLTTIGKYNLDELVNKSVAIISHDVFESIKDREKVTIVDVGIGELYITNIEDTIQYKFIPSKKLNSAVEATYKSKQSPLLLEIDAALGRRITNTYKDLF